MKYISIILMSLFLVGNANARDGDTNIVKSGKVIAFTKNEKGGTDLIVVYEYELYICNVFGTRMRFARATCQKVKDL